jgi:hypothetical protein
MMNINNTDINNQFKSSSLNCNFGLVIGKKKQVHLFDFNYLKVFL